MEILAEAALHESRDCFAKLHEAKSESITAHGRYTHSFRDPLDYGGGRREISITGSKVEEIDSTSDELAVLFRDFGKRGIREAEETIGVGGEELFSWKGRHPRLA